MTHSAFAFVLFAAMGTSPAARAGAAELGRVLGDANLRLVEGGNVPLFEPGSAATVLVFFRPGQERSTETLAMASQSSAALAGKPIRWLALAPHESDVAEVKEALAAAKATLTAVIDEKDALYAAVGVRTHPAIAVVDRDRRVAAFEAYRPIGYSDVLRARVRRAIGEMSDAEVEAALAPPRAEAPVEDPQRNASRHVKLGRMLLAAKALAQAHENARKSLEIVPTAAAWALEGEIFAAEKKCADAERSFDAALKLDPQQPVALERRGSCK